MRPLLARVLVLLGIMLCPEFLPAAQPQSQDEIAGELQDVVSSWASAWQSQFDEVYLMHYHKDFKPDGFKSIEEWKNFRHERVMQPENITILLSGFELKEVKEEQATVWFWLEYSRPDYADRTHKELQLRKDGQIWMIERERNLSVVKLALPKKAQNGQ